MKSFEAPLLKIRDGLIKLGEWGIANGYTTRERLRLTVNARKEAVLQLSGQGLSQRHIAKAVGASRMTVSRDLGVTDGTKSVTNGTLSAKNLAPSTRGLLAQSGQNDWRTPRKFIAAAIQVLGGIDLDPASSAEANETVQAKRFYTESENGLILPWKGRVWLNPPYGENARVFTNRLIKEYEVGNVTGAIALLNSHPPTETQWFHQLFRYVICFVRGRIDFGGPSREVSSTSTHGTAIVYLGREEILFRDVFSEFGAVVKKM
ncbi:MAG: DNA N-6-adenine-methyltransferase [Nitrososphaera sp.]